MATKKAVQRRATAKRASRAASDQAQDGTKAVETEEPAGGSGKQKRQRPVRCIHRHADVELRREFPRVCKGLIEKAAKGGVQQTRLLLDIGKFGEPKKTKRRGAASLSAMLLEELKRRQDEREAASTSAAVESAGILPANVATDSASKGATSGDAEKH